MLVTFNDKAMIVLRADANKNFLTLSLFGGLFTYSEHLGLPTGILPKLNLKMNLISWSSY